MNSFEALALRMINQMLSEQLEEKIGALAAGSSTTFEQYKYQCGYIKALQDVQEFLNTVDKDLRDK
jgi:hypothetical protein